MMNFVEVQAARSMSTAPILDILIFALVLGGAPAPMSCEIAKDSSIRCSNGATATWEERAGYTSVNGIPVTRKPDGHLIFGNGITSSRNAFGWTQFTNGVAIRRDYLGGRPDAYYVNPSLLCQEVTPSKAECKAVR
jgi:hypothetical protein